MVVVTSSRANAVNAVMALVPANGVRRMTYFRYENVGLQGSARTGILWHCEGKLLYQSPHGATDWHGSFTPRVGEFGRGVEIQFNAGRDGPSGPTLLCGQRCLEPCWIGHDCEGRTITLTLLGVWEQDAGSDVWTAV